MQEQIACRAAKRLSICTLIDAPTAARIKAAGLQYAGVSIDGLEATHDRFRRQPGAFRAAVQGIRNCNEAGVKAGIRFTLNSANYPELPGVLDLVEQLRVPRFCMYHLVYAGRGGRMKGQDVTPDQRRQAVQLLIDRGGSRRAACQFARNGQTVCDWLPVAVLDWHRRAVETEVLTTDQHADGAFLHAYITRNLPHRAAEVRKLLEMHGGCSAGCKMSNIDPLGNVHACQFWGHVNRGNAPGQAAEAPLDGWLFYVDPQAFVREKRTYKRRTKGSSGVTQLSLYDDT